MHSKQDEGMAEHPNGMPGSVLSEGEVRCARLLEAKALTAAGN
jgi:hypothetical protein